MFLCQLSKQNTLVPVCTKYGTIYDYHAIMRYIHDNHKDPQTQEPLEESDLTRINDSYLTQTFQNDFSDDKQKLLSRLLYERDALLRVVAKVMQDYNDVEEKPLKRKKVAVPYSFHDFKEEIANSKVLVHRKLKNKQLKHVQLSFSTKPSPIPETSFKPSEQHPLLKVSILVKSKVFLMHKEVAIHEYLLQTKKQHSSILWHCDLQIFFIIYNSFLDIYHINNGYVDTWHIKHDILQVKCCANGYFIGVHHKNQQIDIFDLRRLNDDTKGFQQSIDVDGISAFGFSKTHDLLVFGESLKYFLLT